MSFKPKLLKETLKCSCGNMQNHNQVSSLRNCKKKWVPENVNYCKGVFAWGNLHRHKFHTGITFWFCIVFTWWWVISYLAYLKVHFMLIKHRCNSRSQTLRMRCLSPPADEFHTQMVVNVSCLQDTSVKFHTGVKFSLWYNNHAWHFVVVSCKQI